MPTVHEIVTTLTARAGQFEAALKQSQAAVKRLETEVASLHKRLGNTQPAQAGAASLKQQTSAMAPLIAQAKNLAAAYVTVQAAQKAVAFQFKASEDVERQRRAWVGIAGSVQAGRKELEFVRDAANKLGVSFDSLEEGYRKIAASAKGTTLEGDKTKQIFLDISLAMKTLGAPSEDVAGAMRTLGQMISTGVVQADELRNELGNRLPGVMNLAARSMNMTVQEFRKLQEAGGVLTEEFLPKFARLVKETYVPATQQAGASTRMLSEEWTRFWNLIKEGSAASLEDMPLIKLLNLALRKIDDVLEKYLKLRKALEEQKAITQQEATSTIQAARAGRGPLEPAAVKTLANEYQQLTEKIFGLNEAVQRTREMPWWSGAAIQRQVLEAQLKDAVKERDALLDRVAKLPETAPPFVDRRSEGTLEAQGKGAGPFLAPNRLREMTKERAAILKSMEELGEQLRLIGKTPAEIAREQLKFLEKEYEDFLKKHQKDAALLAPPPATSNALAGEMERIKAAAAAAGVDPNFLAALRQAENGRTGREFGVLSVPAPTYEDQARIAAQTIAANLKRFQAQGGNPFGAEGQYTPDFIKFFSSRYAPLGASNDPTNLNAAHASNLQKFYQAGAMPSMAAPALPATPALPVAPTLPAATGADPIRAKIDSLKEYLDQTEVGVDINQMALEVEQRRAETLKRLLEQLDPLTTKEDALYRAIQLANAEKAADVGNTDAMARSLAEVQKSLDLGSNSLNRYERALAMKQVEQELALMTDQTEAEVIRKKVDAYTTEAAALTRHKKKVEELTLVQKELAQVNEFIAEVDRRRPDEINNIIEAMRRVFPTLKEYEEQLLRLKGLGPGPAQVADAEALRKQSDPAYQAMLDGADNFAANLQSTLIDALSGGKDAWKNFADFAIQEMLRILFEASGFRENMKKLLTEVASILANLLKSAGSGDPNSASFVGPPAPKQHGGPVGMGQLIRAGEAGRELFLSGGKMRLVGMHGPEIIRARAPGFVIPHRQTMSIINRVAHRALGGPLQPGQSTLVGEDGMEAVMGAPNNKGGNTINVPMTIVLPNVQNKQEFLQNQAQLERAAANMMRRAMGRL